MRRHLLLKVLTTVVLSASSAVLWATDSRHTYTVTIHRSAEQVEPSVCKVHTNTLAGDLGLESESQIAYSIPSSVQFGAFQGTTGRFYTTSTLQPYGHYFSATGNVVPESSRNAVVSSQYQPSAAVFEVKVVENRLAEGDRQTVKQGFVNTATNDTVVFVFNLTIDGEESVYSNQPSYSHRHDLVDDWYAIPFVQVNDQAPEYLNIVQANAGDNITMALRPRSEGDNVRFNVTNPAGESVKNMSANDFTMTAVEPADAGMYTLKCYYKAEGATTTKVQTCQFWVDVQTRQGENFDWDADGPYWSYDFRDEYESIPMPEKTHNINKKNGQPANQVHGEWWSVYWGDNLNSEVGNEEQVQKAAEALVKKYDTDFAYIRDEMGWPPDINARQGWKSFVYVFGSGLANDNASNTEEGGYQSATYADGRSWPCVYASYFPFSRFRPDKNYDDGEYQREAMIHEGIHALFADYPGCKKSAWFQEAGNVWLQGAMSARRGEGAQVSGWLGVGNLICPFMPIECYSGWLQDGSFGGPAAEGVNMYNGNQQICTWRNLIGGVQYGETFPIFLGLNVGIGSVPWIWRYCTDYVLKGIAQGNASEGVEGIGDEGMRQLILHYRAKLATMDFKESSNGMRNLLNNSFGKTVKAEWEPYWIDVAPFQLTPYQEMSLNDGNGWYAPDELTNPGWSGGNIIPIHVDVNNGGCEVFFRPEDTNMRAQLCYRTKDGQCFYSQPVLCGKMELHWDSSTAPANGVVFAVPCNTDYIYTGDEQRKHKWDYRLKMGEGAYAPASTKIRWYFYEQDLVDQGFETGIKTVRPEASETERGFSVRTTLLRAGGQVQLDLGNAKGSDIMAHLVGASGILIDAQPVSESGTIQLPAFLPKGLYFLSLNHNGKVQTFKMFAK